LNNCDPFRVAHERCSPRPPFWWRIYFFRKRQDF